jgi:hypothetical protein
MILTANSRYLEVYRSYLLLKGGELIKQCTEYKYLGVKINREGTSDFKLIKELN